MSIVDRMIKGIGFEKTSEDGYHISYERYERAGNFTHVVTILHKANGKHILQSYDKNLFDEKNIGNVGVGLTYKEAKLFLKKMRRFSKRQIKGGCNGA